MVWTLLSGSSASALLAPAAATAVIAYLLGCFNGSVIVSKYILRDDVRTHGSGNAGLTNFYRCFGGPLTAVVILTDMLKAILAVLFGAWAARHFLLNDPMIATLGKYWAGLFCLLGHIFPCMFHFKGGKGILSGGAMALIIDWRVALVVWGTFFLLAALTKYVSLGSICAGISFPLISLYVYRDPVIVLAALLIGAMVVWQHRGNIRRLLSGTESKFKFHNKSGEGRP